MKHTIRTPEDLGMVIRAVRKASQVRQEDLASVVAVSRQFTIDVEKGKPTSQLGLVLKLMNELGIHLSVDIPQEASLLLTKLTSEKAQRHEKP